MGRKKEKKIEYEPSEYQKNIYDFVEHNVGNLVVEASAGAGKTSTLLEVLKRLPSNKKILFCAFNKDIVKEIDKKVDKNIKNVDIRTIHSLGLLMIQRNLKLENIIPNENKYKQFIYNNINEITSIDYESLSYKDKSKYIDNICKLIDYSRYNLAETEKDIKVLIERYDIDILGDEINITIDMLNWGKNYLEEIDFTDMIWLPNVLYLKPLGLQYDYILLDESQDVSSAQRELILKCRKINTRMFSFGDNFQCIYSFASADPESFNKLKSLPNTSVLPLSISYRCPKNIVRFAQTLVPSIEFNELNPIEGEVKYNVKLDEVQDGDMVLCRNNAPLMKVYSDFIRLGKKCKIRGKDIGLNLKNLVKSIKQKELNVSLEKDGLFARLYLSLFNDRDKLMNESGLDKKTVMSNSKIMSKLDTIKALEVLSEGINTSEELIENINNIFSDKKIDGISLSTIHKAKGLEANNVFIVCPSLMPCKSATKNWEIEQEKNLMYVAYTRAKNTLSFIDESEFKDFTDVSTEPLNKIETQINKLFNLEKLKHTSNHKNTLIEISKIKKPTVGTSIVLGNVKKQNNKSLLIKNNKKKNR